MTRKVSLQVPLNRVEGDLEIRVELEGSVVRDAWSSGTLYRGFENILLGRGALDGLVITPRICGICSTSHLTAACLALEAAVGAAAPPGALRLRHAALLAEHIQSDLRQAFLMFAADFVNPKYRALDLYEEAVARYAPFEGATCREVVQETKRFLGLVAIVGGQWPHSAYMVPGGVTALPGAGDLLQCRTLARQMRAWYERRVLGCSIERLREVTSRAALEAWLEESDAHRGSELGFFLRFARAAGFAGVGRGTGAFVSFGAFELPEGTALRAPGGGAQLVPAGFARGGAVSPFDPGLVAEHVSHSWYEEYEGGRHPSEGETRPYACGEEGGKYSWAKAPRYDGHPAETGPLAEAIVAGDPLLCDLAAEGADLLVRELARVLRPARFLPALEQWLAELSPDACLYRSPGEVRNGTGVGLTQAARGALGHWIRLEEGRIAHYQVITPTAWNGSPRDGSGRRGPWEEALVGTEVRDPEDPVELGHVVRSFDPCLVCTVHAVDARGAAGRWLRL